MYSTLSVTLERFFAIVFPFKDFDTVKRFLIPFTAAFAVLYNIPKYFELTTEVDAKTNETAATATELRANPHYKHYYIFWSKFLLIELFPYLLILVLNSFILVKILKSSKFRKRILRSTTRRYRYHGGGNGNGRRATSVAGQDGAAAAVAATMASAASPAVVTPPFNGYRANR